MNRKTQLRLRFLSAPFEGQEICLQHAPVTLGRDESCYIQIGDTENSLSRRHAQFHCPNGADWFLEDLRSSNKTFLNQRPLNPGEHVPIPPRAEVAFGRLEAIVQVEPSVSQPVPQPSAAPLDVTVTEPRKPTAPPEPEFDPDQSTRWINDDESIGHMSWPTEEPADVSPMFPSTGVKVNAPGGPQEAKVLAAQPTDPNGNSIAATSLWDPPPNQTAPDGTNNRLRKSSNNIPIHSAAEAASLPFTQELAAQAEAESFFSGAAWGDTASTPPAAPSFTADPLPWAPDEPFRVEPEPIRPRKTSPVVPIGVAPGPSAAGPSAAGPSAAGPSAVPTSAPAQPRPPTPVSRPVPEPAPTGVSGLPAPQPTSGPASDQLKALFLAFGESLDAMNEALKQAEKALPQQEELKSARKLARQTIVRLAELRGFLGL